MINSSDGPRGVRGEAREVSVATNVQAEARERWGYNNPLPAEEEAEALDRSALRTTVGDEGAAESTEEEDEDDPHNLEERYIMTHMRHYPRALEEIRTGRKRSCWSWYIFPTEPWIVNGRERGSGMNRHYSLRTEEQARAYLRFERRGVNLRRNLLEIWREVEVQLDAGVSFQRLIGVVDDPKVRCNLRLFEHIARQEGDEELQTLLERVMGALGEDTRDVP